MADFDSVGIGEEIEITPEIASQITPPSSFEDIPVGGEIDVPAGFLENSTPLEQKRQHTYRESTGTVVDAPYGMTPQEIENYDDLQNHNPSAFETYFIDPVVRGIHTANQAVGAAFLMTGLTSEEFQGREIMRSELIKQAHAPNEKIKKGIEEIGSSKTFGEALSNMIKNPAAFENIMLESVASSAPALATSLAGPAGGGFLAAAWRGASFGVGSGVTEYGSALLDILNKRGVDLSDLGKVKTAINTPEFMQEAQSRGLKRGVIIGMVDAISAGLAGKLGTPVATRLGGGAAAKTAGGATEVGAQAASGALGEAGGQLATDKKITSPADVVMEAAAEVVSGIPEIVRGSEIAGQPVPNTEPPATQEGEGAQSITETEAPSVQEEVAPQSRTEVTMDNAIPEATPVPQQVKPEEMVARALNKKEQAREEVISSEAARDSATMEAAETKMRDARLRRLDQQVDQIDSQIDGIEAQIEERQAQGKATRALEKKLDRLLERREPMDEERANLLTASDAVIISNLSGDKAITDKDIATNLAAKGDVTIKGGALQSMAKTTIKERMRAVQKGLREGVLLAKTDTKAAQEAVIAAIEQSGLPLSEKGKYLATVKNIQTSEQAAKALPRLAARINTTLNKIRKKDLRSAIKNTLKATKVRKQSGKPVGKFGDADLQRTFDALRAASKMTKSAAAEKLLSNLENPEPTIETTLENQILAIVADLETTPAESMEETLFIIRSMVEEGKIEKLAQIEERRDRINETKEQIVNTLLKGRDIEDISQINWKDRLIKSLNSVRAAESGINNAWFDTLDIMLGVTAEGRKARDKLEDPVFRAIQEEKRLITDLGNAFVQTARDVFGINKKSALNKKLIADEKIEYLGDFARDGQVEADEESGVVLVPKKPTRWEISRAQARKLWMEMQDPTVRETLVDPEGNGITIEMEEALNDFLTPEDKQFAEAQLRLYKEIYPKINDVYSKIYGVHLPDNPFYSPIRRRHKEKIGQSNEFLQEIKNRMSAGFGGLKSRVKTNAKILPQSDITAMLTHITQAAHFISMAETAQDLQSVFSSPAVREAIDATWGERMKENIDNYIMDFTSGQIQRAEGWMRMVDALNSSYAKSVLGAKINMIPKQMSSLFAYATDIPVVHFMAGLEDFAANPARAIKILSQSDLMKQRGASQDVDIAKGAQQQAKKLLGGERAAIDEFFLSPVKYGDRSAIYVGGWPVYKYHRDVLGQSHEEALKAFEKSTAMMQQSSDLNQLSRMQASRNPFMRTMGMFMSAPNAYYRAEKRAWRQWWRGAKEAYKGEISKSEFASLTAESAKKIAIMHVVLPSLFQYIANGFYWDDDDQKRAAALGSLNGFLLLGPILETAVSAFFDIKRRGAGQNILFAEGIQELFSAITDAIEKGFTWEELLEGVDAIGKITGLPIETLRTIAGSKEALEAGYPDVAAKEVLGYTEKTAAKPYM